MGDLNIQNRAINNSFVFIAENIQSEISKLRVNRLSDTLLNKHLNFYYDEIEKIKELAINNPRFKWQLLEQEIDLCYKRDRSLTGANVVFDWNDSTTPNRLFLKLKL